MESGVLPCVCVCLWVCVCVRVCVCVCVCVCVHTARCTISLLQCEAWRGKWFIPIAWYGFRVDVSSMHNMHSCRSEFATLSCPRKQMSHVRTPRIVPHIAKVEPGSTPAICLATALQQKNSVRKTRSRRASRRRSNSEGTSHQEIGVPNMIKASFWRSTRLLVHVHPKPGRLQTGEVTPNLAAYKLP